MRYNAEILRYTWLLPSYNLRRARMEGLRLEAELKPRFPGFTLFNSTLRD